MSPQQKMSFLKTTKVKVVPIWLIIIITFGTAAGTLLWISNQISTEVDPAITPITISGSFDTSPTMEVVSASVFSYSINDDTKDVGYIVLEFQSNGGLDYVGSANFTVEVEYQPFGEIVMATQVVSGYPINKGVYAIQYVFEQNGGGAIDFGPSGTINGDFTIRITYHVSFALTVIMQFSSTSS